MPGDTQFAKVSLLLRGEGFHGSTAFADRSPRPKAISSAVGPTITTSVSKYGGSALAFTGAGNVQVAASADFDFGSADFTVECWLKSTSALQYATIISKGSGGGFTSGAWSLMVNYTSPTSGDVAVFLFEYSAGTPILATTGVDVTDDAWHHIAWVRYGNDHYIYVDGVVRASRLATSVAIASLTYTVGVGADLYYSPRQMLGTIDDLRVTKGLARYTADFSGALPGELDDYYKRVAGVITGPGGEFLARDVRLYLQSSGVLVASTQSAASDGTYLLGVLTDDEVTRVAFAADPLYDLNRASVDTLLAFNGADDSTTLTDIGNSPRTFNCVGTAKLKTAQKKFGTASLYLDGTGGGYAVSAASGIPALGLSDFCLEVWVYQVARSSADATVFDTLPIGGGGARTNAVAVTIAPSGTAQMFTGGSTRIAAGHVALNIWTHIALVRQGGAFVLYVGGAAVGSWTGAVDCTSNDTMIGAQGNVPTDPAYTFNGYFDDLRLTRGVARYPGAFFPPAYPHADPANATEVLANNLIDRVLPA